MFDAIAEAQKNEVESRRAGGSEPSGERESIAAQAQRLLNAEVRRNPTWEDVGEPVEVETDVPLSRDDNVKHT